MFVSQAHSFRQQSRLAITLAWVAGYTNILTALTCGTFTSHVSGVTSNLGRDLSAGSWPLAAFAGFILLTFFAGAAISGFCTEMGRSRAWESIYVLPIAIEGGLLGIFAAVLQFDSRSLISGGPSLYWMVGSAAAAMGLQNATITRISSGTIRTTHMTGVLTDLGHESVQFVWWLVDRATGRTRKSISSIAKGASVEPSALRLALLASILGSFTLGAGLGTLAYYRVHRWAMFLPVAFLLWIVYQDIAAPIAEIETSALEDKERGLELPEGLSVYELKKDHQRKGGFHRMPNLLVWSERIPQSARVVILDLAAVTQLDSNAGLEIRAVVTRFRTEGRELIIAGIDGKQFQQMNHAGGGQLLPADNACPDLELAIARGMNLLAQMQLAHMQIAAGG